MATKRSIFKKLKHIKRGTQLGNADNFITVDIDTKHVQCKYV